MKKQPAPLEDNLQALETILAKMSGEETTLAESIALYADAARLIESANRMLDDARLKIAEIDQVLAAQCEPEEPAAEEPTHD